MTATVTLLVTGGAGFIGSHTCLSLLQAGHHVVAVDDLSNASARALERVSELAGRPVTFVCVDLRDRAALDALLAAHAVDAVVHFAAKKAVGESVQIPLEYYDINVGGTVTLLSAMRDHGVSRLVFSSSCSIYGDAQEVPIREDAPPQPTNPYARTKWMCEQILRDACARHPDWSVTALRYFNPAGAHPSGLLGEDPRGVPNNVLPYLMQVAVGRLERLAVFGGDYATPDGTGVRDYLHVVDLAEGHRVAYDRLADGVGFRAYNLGTGVGTSVLQLVEAFRAVTDRELPYEVVGRRAGDVAELVADPSVAAAALGWKSTRNVAEMVRDAWRFQSRNPGGYEEYQPRAAPGRSGSNAGAAGTFPERGSSR